MSRIYYDTVQNFTNHIKEVRDKSSYEKFSEKSISLLREQACKPSLHEMVWDYIENPKNHDSAFWRLLKLVPLSFKNTSWPLQNSKTRCFYSDLYGIFHLNSWTLDVCSIAMWHSVQSNGVLEVLKTGCSLKDYIEHVTNLKYEKERNSVTKSMKPESTSFPHAS